MNLHLLRLFSSLLLLLFLPTSPASSASTAAALPPDLRALISLKSYLQSHHTFHGWEVESMDTKLGRGDPVWCSWTGVQCRGGQVTNLDLSRRNLSGSIPTDINLLTSLLHLNLSGNSFDGIFPSTIFNLPNLRILDISHNNFNSTFPPGISKLKFLRVFNAYSNNFTGALPKEFMFLRFLEQLNLGGSYFEGEIPIGYGSFPRLKFLHLGGNSFDGPLPPQLGFLTQLERMEIGYNSWSGKVPVEFSLLSNLNYLDISTCFLSGNLTRELGNLTQLESLLLFKNQFTGEIPESFCELKSLRVLDLSENKLTGVIPEGISKLKELTRLSLMNNELTGEIPQGIGELPNLDTLSVWNNSLTGTLPGNLGSNSKLEWLDVSSNLLTGEIPASLCNGNKLYKLILFSNGFSGELPDTLANCSSLSRFRIQNNQLNGSIPLGFGSLSNLTFVDLSQNNFSGEIPADFGNAPVLQYFNISENRFESGLPNNIWSAPNLQIFSASKSRIVGKIPEFVGCSNVYKIELQGNLLNGTIPWDIGHCEKLLCLNLSHNSLTGIIPWEISALPSITDVDLSRNFLTGSIPSNFGNCSTIETFNVSYNLLTGPIPSSGTIFPNLHPSSFLGNDGLCGGGASKPCASPAANAMEVNDRNKRTTATAGAIVWVTAATFGICLFVLVATTRCMIQNRRRKHEDSRREIGPWKLTAFQRLNFTAEDVVECLETSNNKIIGMGSAGTVYKAEMPGGEVIAVKKLWSGNKETSTTTMIGGGCGIGGGRRKGGGAVVAEVEVLGNVRHRNIVRLLGCCSNRDCTMLLYEYMPNGSLDDLLHGKRKETAEGADWVERHRIAIGVAQGICYLHHDCDPVIVHRDLKPSNILLDGEMEARVADFGVAKLIQSDAESMSVIAGSYGYIAPEYAYTLQVDEKSDIYSYGVVLMEILSGKRSVGSEFGEGNSIVDWVRSKIKTKEGFNDVLDNNAGAGIPSVREEMMQMLKIALLCTSRNPADRPSMRDVVIMLQAAAPKRKLVVVSDAGGESRVVEGEGGVVVQK